MSVCQACGHVFWSLDKCSYCGAPAPTPVLDSSTAAPPTPVPPAGEVPSPAPGIVAVPALHPDHPIHEWKMTVRFVNGEFMCPSCNRGYSRSGTACPSCGTPNPLLAIPCVKCGGTYSWDAPTCRSCGEPNVFGNALLDDVGMPPLGTMPAAGMVPTLETSWTPGSVSARVSSFGHPGGPEGVGLNLLWIGVLIGVAITLILVWILTH